MYQPLNFDWIKKSINGPHAPIATPASASAHSYRPHETYACCFRRMNHACVDSNFRDALILHAAANTSDPSAAFRSMARILKDDVTPAKVVSDQS